MRRRGQARAPDAESPALACGASEADCRSALQSRIARASSGVATSSPNPSMIWRAARTCAAFDSASVPGPSQRLSSSPIPHVAAHRRRLRGHHPLIPSGAEHAPAVLVTKQAIRRAFHVQNVLGMRADPTEDGEYALEKSGGFTTPRSRKFFAV